VSVVYKKAEPVLKTSKLSVRKTRDFVDFASAPSSLIYWKLFAVGYFKTLY
jgi:hypothetical protein